MKRVTQCCVCRPVWLGVVVRCLRYVGLRCRGGKGSWWRLWLSWCELCGFVVFVQSLGRTRRNSVGSFCVFGLCVFCCVEWFFLIEEGFVAALRGVEVFESWS